MKIAKRGQFVANSAVNGKNSVSTEVIASIEAISRAKSNLQRSQTNFLNNVELAKTFLPKKENGVFAGRLKDRLK
jgi:hypothetical protein